MPREPPVTRTVRPEGSADNFHVGHAGHPAAGAPVIGTIKTHTFDACRQPRNISAVSSWSAMVKLIIPSSMIAWASTWLPLSDEPDSVDAVIRNEQRRRTFSPWVVAVFERLVGIRVDGDLPLLEEPPGDRRHSAGTWATGGSMAEVISSHSNMRISASLTAERGRDGPVRRPVDPWVC